MKTIKNTETLSAKNMKTILWETLQAVRAGDLDVSSADAIALQCREIIRVIKTQQSIIGQAGQQITDELVEYATK